MSGIQVIMLFSHSADNVERGAGFTEIGKLLVQKKGITFPISVTPRQIFLGYVKILF
jgi:hypothetical protein